MDNYCCINCFSEPEINNFIKSGEEIGDCDYCESKGIEICSVIDVGSFIMEGFHRYYEDAANQVGYLMPTSCLTEILLYQEEIFSDELSDPEKLLTDLVADDATPYVRRDPYGPPSGDPDEIRYWENFCKTVKTKKRFTTFLSSENEDKYDHGIPRNFLSHLASNFIPSLIHVLQPGEKIYRARINNQNKKLLHKDLTSPPHGKSRNSRMSPVGISFFYGGLTPEVCIHEVRPSVSENVEVAEFQVVKELFILNLAVEIESYKSIFDSEYYFTYEEYFKPFLEHFANDISKPIRKTDNEIGYVPTQILTEFIKEINFKNSFSWRDANGNETDVFINGIQFKSSIMKEGINLVLFKGPDISTSIGANKSDTWLRYKGKKSHEVVQVIIKSKKA